MGERRVQAKAVPLWDWIASNTSHDIASEHHLSLAMAGAMATLGLCKITSRAD